MKCSRCGHVDNLQEVPEPSGLVVLRDEHDCVGRRLMQERIRIVEALRDAGRGACDGGLNPEGLALLKVAAAILDIKEDP